MNRNLTMSELARHCRHRGYEVARILRAGCIMHRPKDGKEVLITRDGKMTYINVGVKT